METFSCSSKDPSIPLNYALFLYNSGDRRLASKQFSQFEQRVKMAKQGQQSMDQEVSRHLKKKKNLFEHLILREALDSSQWQL